ncbi:MAG: hypothetical protein AAGI13_00540 [Pseudomonadota bacterium]
MTVTEKTRSPDIRAQIAMLERSLAASPQIPSRHLPTPPTPFDHLPKAMGGPRIRIKRGGPDGAQGQVSRSLAFLLAEALRLGAACMNTQARQFAAACDRIVLTCHLLRPKLSKTNRAAEDPFEDPQSACNPTQRADKMVALADQRTAQGARPIVFPDDAARPLGALGHIRCATELSRQAQESGTQRCAVIRAVDGPERQAGLLAGLCSIGSKMQLWGIGMHATRDIQPQRKHGLATAIAGLLGKNVVISRHALHPHPSLRPADQTQTAPRYGLQLDPRRDVPARAGRIDIFRSGQFDGLNNSVFLHSGGSAAPVRRPRTLRSAWTSGMTLLSSNKEIHP